MAAKIMLEGSTKMKFDIQKFIKDVGDVITAKLDQST